MKKLLTVFLAAVMCATLIGAFAACKSGIDEEATANAAIRQIREVNADKDVETATDYTVMGAITIDGTAYKVDWSVSSEYENFGNYISVGAMDETTKLVTVSVTKAPEEIQYKLTASVTVGEVTKSVSFDRKVPAGVVRDDETKTVSLTFDAAKANRTSYSTTQQVWEENGVKMTNDKANSSNNIGDYAAPIRLYVGTTIKIERAGMINLVFHTEQEYDDNQYVTFLKTNLEAAYPDATIEADIENKKVTVELANAVDEITFSVSPKQLRIYSVDVEYFVNGISDATRVAGAKAMLAIEEKYTAAGSYDLPATKNGATITWAVKEASEYVSIKDGKLSVDNLPADEAQVVLVATIKSGSEEATKEITITLKNLGLTNDGTAEHPYTTTEAILVANSLEAGGYSDEVYVKGYVVDYGDYNSKYTSYNIWIAETFAADKDKTSEDALYIYSIKTNGTTLTEDKCFNKGDEVVLSGKLQNYQGNTPELTSAQVVSVKEVEITEEMIAEQNLVKALNAVKDRLDNVRTVGEVQLPASTVDGVTFTWSTENTTYTVSENKLNVAELPTEGDVTVTLKVTATYGATATKDKTVTIVIKGPVVIPTELTTTTVLIKEYGVANGTKKTEWDIADGIITLNIVDHATGQYHNSGNCYDNDQTGDGNANVRIYQNETPEIIFTAATGCTIRSIKITYTVSNTGVLTNADRTVQYESDSVITVNAETVTFSVGNTGTATNGQVRITAIEVKYQATSAVADELTDEEKVDAALAALKLNTKVTETGEVNLPTANNVTITWSSNNTEYISVVNNEKLNVLKFPDLTDVQVEITASVNSGGAEGVTKEKKFTFTLAAPIHLEGAGTEEDPFTVADVISIGSTLDGDKKEYYGGDTPTLVYVKGYVTNAGTFNASNSRFSKVYIADAADGTDTVQIYTITAAEDSAVTKEGDIFVGRYIVVSGYIQQFGKTLEITYSGDNVVTVVEKGDDTRTDAEKAAAALESISATLADITEAGDVPLDTTSKVENVTLEWSTENTTYTVSENTLNVAELPTEEDANVTLVVRATCGEAYAEKNVTVVIKKQEGDNPNPGTDKTLTLTSESITAAGTGSSGYAKYNGSREIEGYTIVTTAVMPAKPTKYDKDTIQMQKTNGVLTLSGDFTKIVIKAVSTYDYDKAALPTVTAGDSPLTGTLTNTESTGVMNGTYEYKIYTIEYTVTGGAQEIKLSASSSGAVNLASIEFTIAESDDSGNASVSNIKVLAPVDDKKYAL